MAAYILQRERERERERVYTESTRRRNYIASALFVRLSFQPT
jgi:hypothetical protein